MAKIINQRHRVPNTPGKKIIEELVGVKTTKQDDLSIAHMLMPAGWREEGFHSSAYHEYAVIIKGELTIIDNGVKIVVKAGEIGDIPPTKNMLFRNDGKEVCEYWAICRPAYQLHLADYSQSQVYLDEQK